MAYKIAVCDDDPAAVAGLSDLVTRWAGDRAVDLRTFSSGQAFLFAYAGEKDFDLLLLDVEMGRPDGVTLAKTVRRDNARVQIVFVTGYSDYMAEGFEVAALHYLVKPVREEKLFEVLDRAVDRLEKDQKTLLLKLPDELVRVPLGEIRCLDVSKNYVTVHGVRDYTVKKSLGEFESQLDQRFFRVGRSCILNLTFVQRVTRDTVYLSDGTEIPLPRGAYEALNRAIIERL